MDQRIIQILFALLRSAICGTKLTEEEYNNYSPEMLQDLLKISSKHDVAHLLVLGLKQNDLIPKEKTDIEKCILKAVYRYEQIKYEYDNLCTALEKAQIPFLPLKGAVIRKYYPEEWMRTSCDIDVLVREEDIEKSKTLLVNEYGYKYDGKGSHDISLFSPANIHVELHYDLVEDGRANASSNVLKNVWNVSVVRDGCAFWYEMPDEYYYFYHIAHMAKHFENGGCGIRPFIDLWILDHMKDIDISARDELLSQGRLLKFSNVSRMLSEVWFGGKEPDELSLQMQAFLLHGGVYGSTDNRVALQQKKKGGRMGYVLSRIFIPYAKLKRYYPVLEKHRWLMPLMQIRRWFMLLKPDVAKMAKREMAINGNLAKTKSDEMNDFLDYIGLN
ncbi:MAG: nucleotidyltransferase family protein [Clostridia bacterium]|nr:nucleotidyltransferase family protein [Clostridia bacterium]